MNKNLFEFISDYGAFCNDDLELIAKWAIYNGYQTALIGKITELAQSLVDEGFKFQHRTKEWCTYAMSLVPEISADTDFETCINAIRLAFLAYDGMQFTNAVDYILTSNNITIQHLDEMHPEIAQKYHNLKNTYINREEGANID